MSSASPQYLAFVLFPDRVSIVLWQQTSGKIQVLSQSNIIDATSGQNDDLSRAIDTALDELGPDGLAVKEALFIVPPDWIEAGDLSTKKKNFLKNLTHDLMLEPLGYVVLSDTLLAHEAAQSPPPFEGVLVYDSAREWLLEKVINGQVSEMQRVGKSQDLTADTAELHSRLLSLGAVQRAILIPLDPLSHAASESTLESAVQTSLETMAPEDFLRIAVTIGGSEILQTTTARPDIAALTDQTVPSDTGIDDFQAVDPEMLNNVVAVPAEDALLEETSTPVAAAAPTVWDIEPQEGQRVTEVSPAGFVIHRSAQDATPDISEDELPQATETPLTSTPKRSLPKISWPSLPKLSGLKLAGKRKKFAVIGGALAAVLLVGSAAGYWQLSRSYTANVTVWLAPQEISEEFRFSAGAAAASNSGTLPLPGEIISETVTLDTEVPATGTKVTGDPAQGDVTIFNKTSQTRSFDAGTKLQADGKVFELTEGVTVASASTKENTGSSTTVFGTADAKAKAVEIGPEGNINKDTKFSVANFDSSSVEAQAKDSFSGGTKREIQAVSQQDIDRAAQQLRQAALDQVKANFEQMQQDGNTLFPSGQITVTAVTASPERDEEAKFVSVSLTATGEALKLTADQTSQKGQELLVSSVGEDQELLPDTVAFEANDVTVSPDGRTFLLTAKVTGKAVKRVMAEDLKRKVAGLYTSRASTVLSEVAGVGREEVSIEPAWMSWMFSSIPLDPERIQLNIKLDREV